jgi:hypothetical protein
MKMNLHKNFHEMFRVKGFGLKDQAVFLTRGVLLFSETPQWNSGTVKNWNIPSFPCVCLWQSQLSLT